MTVIESNDWARARFREICAVAAARIAALIVAGSGVLNLVALLKKQPETAHAASLAYLFPLDFTGGSRTLDLIAGLALVFTAANLLVFRRRAWQVALALTGASVIYHLARRQDYVTAACALAVLTLLVFTRRSFSVGSQPPQLGTAALRVLCAFAIAGAYGAAGFWLLEPVEFHHNFHWWEASFRTVRLMLFLGDDSLVPHTLYAAWFMHSLSWISATAFVYGGVALFRPVAYRFYVDRDKATLAEAITAQYGRTGQDFFKHWPDKTYFFLPEGRAFLAYRVARDYALVLGDPVGPEEEIQETIRRFVDFCRKRGWRVGFHQVSEDYLRIYERLGFRNVKVGDEAIVDLDKFSLAGSAMKEFRNTVNRLDRLGYRVERIATPVSQAMLTNLRQISDRWLAIPGHRERQFTLGRFEPWYLQTTPIYVVFDPDGDAVAFLNLIPSYDPAVATVDLMRRSPESINGVMDYLFAKVFLDLKQQGIRHFNLGMVPLSTATARKAASLEERLMLGLMKRMPFVFRADSLGRFKAKYADFWTPRYSVYQSRLHLPRLGLALRRICELPAEETRRAA